MTYEFVVTVPANTPKNVPFKQNEIISTGIITHYAIEMARGCHQMVHCTICEGKFQIFPRNPEGTHCTDAHVIESDAHYEVKRGHTELTIICWSPDTAYDHDVRIRLTVLPKETVTLVTLVKLITKAFSKLGLV